MLIRSFILLAIFALPMMSCSKDGATNSATPGDTTEKPVQVQETAYAFPGAEGFGRNATGGRGGKVIKVTNLNDAGPGSLREAINATGARIIIFEVSGIITLKSKLAIKNGDLTIAGQTAPGDGICIRDYTVELQADNAIIRYMRFRLGNETVATDADGSDAFTGRGHKNIIIDHCSMSWSIDECASFYDNQNFTMQWCIISESLRNAGHSKGAHGYGGIWGGQKASFHHNLLADHDSRNPRFCGSRYTNRADLERVDFRNNVIFNWGANSAYAGEGGQYNMVGNYYKPGPDSKNKTRIFQPNADDGTNAQAKGVWGQFYLAANTMNGSATVTSDNWQGMNINGTTTADAIKLQTAWDTAGGGVKTHTADMAYDRVLNYAGASYKRDAVDTRIIGDARSGTPTIKGSSPLNAAPYPLLGLIDTQTDVGGWPVYNSTLVLVNTAGDGIPDEWKRTHKLEVTKNVANQKDLSTAYDNIEVYINSIVKDITEGQK